MHLLQSGVPFNVIALWLGHESMNTTHRYVEANLAMKEKALARLEPPRYQDRQVSSAGRAHAVPADAVTMRRRYRRPSVTTLGVGAFDLWHLHIVAISA